MSTTIGSPGAEPRLVPAPAFGALEGNADFDLEPKPSPGRGSVAFDFPGVEVGTAEYSDGPTGATVVYVPAGARTAIDDRGGAIGIVGRYEYNHAICLAGGSVYGLGAAAGVSAELLRREQNQVDWQHLRTVSGAIIYDFSARDNAITPDAALGAAALEWALPGEFPVGRCGAGAAASAGKVDYGRAEFTGQGAAFRQVGRAKILVATVANPVGVIVDRDGAVVRGNYDPATGTREHPESDFASAFAAEASPRTQRGNTTLTVVVTNVALADRELSQFSKQVHSSMHRAIQPFHSSLDGDTLFALTTDEVDLAGVTGEAELSCVGLGAIASEVAWDAVLSSAA